MTIDDAKIKIEELACYARTKGWDDEYTEAVNMAIKALEQQEPCENVPDLYECPCGYGWDKNKVVRHHFCPNCGRAVDGSIKTEREHCTDTVSRRCKNCKYFEYDSVAEVNGIPLIVAHEICKRWSGGCQTKEDGYCFLFEPQESEVEE